MDGREAFDIVKRRFEKDQSIYKLILMDICMPFCNGLESAVMIRQFLRERAPVDKQPYIVCLTGYTEQKFRDDAQKSGMDYFQAKPIFKPGVWKLLVKSGLASGNDKNYCES